MKKESVPDREIRKLIQKAFKGEITAEEKKLLDDWYASFEEEKPVVYSELSKKEFEEKHL